MTKRYTLTLLLLCFISLQNLFSQCTDGTQPECQCSTAPVLCTVDDLDNYMFSMSSFQHPQNGPTPLCPGANNSVPNNPTWFAFTAWCTDLTLEASFSNCTQVQGSIGVQIAIYEDCSFNNAVACNVNANNCNTNSKTLTMTGLTIGGVYYFLVDGCLGSYCDVTIDIIGTCGEEEIAPWTQGVTGETNACGGNTETYSVETLAGAATYHWFVDGVLVGTSSTPTFDIPWTTAGSYQLCIDASNDPCVPITDDPPQLCTTINVYESEAGTISAPTPLCPGAVANISVSGYNMGVDNAQASLITDASGMIVEVINGATGTFTSTTCGTFTIYSYNYIPAIGTTPVVGNNVNAIDCAVECCDLESMTISFEDTEFPVFTNPPADETLTCSDLVPMMMDLDWTDNCDGAGTVAGTESGSADVCNGGTITRTWEYTDSCGNTTTHTQTITVDPAAAPTFTNPPADETVTCDNIPTSAADLSYTNGGAGACEISGMVSPTQSGSADICGGTISFTWDFTDACGNNISHTQNVTVTPANPPTFINPPADVSVTCDNIPTSAPDLNYTNNENGSCLVSGTVSPTQSGSADMCGGSFSFTWDFTDICGNNISHTQTITVTPANPPTFINPPADIVVTCDNIPTSAPDLNYTNNENGSCLVSGTISPTQSGSADMCGGSFSFTWDFTDMCGNNISHTQNVTVTPPAPPTFINPPADIVVTCDNIPTSAPDLNYTNNENGSCLVSGTISPTQSGSADMCGGSFSFTWDFTDMCGNNISHTQNVTVTPPAPPAFINPPADIVVTCDNIPTSAPDLNYTNNENGSCLVSGIISPTQSGSADMCGGSFSFTWDFTDMCGNNISHTQNVTVTPPAPPAFINPPADVVVTCDNIPTSAPDLNYTNNENGSCLVSGTISPTQSGSANICGGSFSFTWNFTDMCGNNISHTQNITVTPPAPPAFINPPANLVVTCDNIPTGAPDLDYTNNENGSCLVMGSVSPTQSGNADICGGTISYTWDFTDVCGNNISHTQNITVTPANAPAFINPPTDQTVSCDNIPTGAPDLDYTNNENGSCLVAGTVSPTQSGSADECGGTISYTWTFTDICNNTITYIQNYTVDPAPQASFIGGLPQNVTVDCDNVPGLPGPLQYTNNESGVCAISGSAQATQSGNYNECGGLIVFLWQFTDACGRMISHVQNVTVNPAPPAVFINPPGATSFDCSSVPTILPTLNYTNSQSGTCSINGTVTAIQSGFYDACGGNITYTWTFIDDCNRFISHSQNVVVTPASDPMFTSMPPDMTINCGEPFPTPINLPYTNNESGNCAITGTVPATITSNGNGGMEYTWTFTNPCNNFTITHTQIIDQTPSPDISINPTQVIFCEGENFDLSTITVTDLNNTNPNITFHSGTPATIANQLASSIVSPLVSTTYYILASNSFGCSDETSFDVVVEDPPFAGFDGMGEICYDSPHNINLFSYLTGAYSPTGTWVDVSGSGVNLSNPNNISLVGLPAGTYTFDYVVASGGVCPDDVASVTLEYLPEVFIFAFDILCAADPDFYEVSINNFGFDIIVLAGTYTDLGNNMGIVTDIPIGQSLIIIATNPSNLLCTFTLNIAPPDCNCPNVDPPVSNGDAIICEGAPAPQLSVTVGTDETANWYDAPSGGVLLQSGSTTFTPTETAIGVYTYYVETENLTSGCVSSILTPIQFEISENPSGNNAQLEECDLDGDGFAEFDLTGANTLISSNSSYFYTYYETLSDAQNGIGSLPNIYTNTDTPTQTLFVVVSNSANCNTIVELELIVNPPPSITLQIDNETCLGDGDGSVTINVPTGVNYSLDNSNWTTNNIFDNLISGNYTAYVEDGNGCIASQNFDINPGLEITMSSFEINCNDNGTPSDASDDNYNITFTLTNNNGNAGTFSAFDGNLNIPSLNYNQSNTISLPAQGQSLTLTFSDELTNCLITQAVGPLDPCSSDCSISIDQLDIVCSDNGTSNDLTDDFYTVTINASAINGAANNSYNVLIDGVVNFNYTYNNASTFTIPADGSSPIIAVVDNQDPQCQATQTIGPLVSCSDPCIINFDLVEVNCNDNGTITDPNDDFYEINIQASAINPGASNSFEIFANNISQGTFDYATGAMFNLPADGNSVLILIQDADEPLCSAEQNIGTLEPCDEDCTINATVSNIICDDNGTGNDDTDDTFTFDLLVSGQNISASWQSTDGTLSGSYGTTLNFGSFNIAGGDLNFDLQDLTTLTCITSVLVNAPATCSDPCVINFDLVELNCNDNGTITDPNDDFYEINIQASAVNSGASNSFEIFANNISQGTFDYATGGMFNLPADGNSIQILIQDADEPLCSAEQNIGILEPCNEDCTINATVSNIICDDNGTGNDDTDDTFTFDLLVNGQNIGASWQSTDGTISGSYGTTQNFGPFNIAGGDLNFDLQDLTTLTCITSVLVNTPATCSDPCVINFDLVEVNCNDNGTITDPTDDFYEINIQASAVNSGASNSFEIFANNISQGTFDYATGAMFNLPADGNSVLILIQDADEPLCSAEQNIGTLEPCDEDCTINATVSNIICDDNGTGNDDTDDTFTFDLLVNGQNIGASWQSTDGTLSGSYGTTLNFGSFNIAGGDLNFDLQDLTTLTCITSVLVNAPATCSDPCVINFDLVEVNCNDNGTITDPTDDFYEINIQASAVNSGASNSFEIFANNISQGTFDYATGAMFNLPADGNSVQILIQDADEPLCSAEQNIGILEPCNEDCTINATVSNIICDDNGTGNDDTDDTFTFDLLVNGQNIGASWQSTDGTLSGSYGTTQNFGPFNIAGGDLNFDLQDLTTLTCVTSISVNAPATCSDPCVINFDLVEVNCNDNGTITDPTDDFYEINIQASAINPGASNSFEIFVNNISQGTFDYATGAMFNLPADGNSVLILIQDADEPLCSAEQNIGTLEPCNEDCTINATVSNIICDDNGTGNDDTDDTFTFDLLVNGQNIGASWQSTDGTLSGSYGTTLNFGPFNIANGDLNFDLQDLTTLTCITSVSVNTPATCSDPCVINFDLVDVNCNDNGTITDPNDDFHEINIQASAINPGASNSFEIFANNISQGTFDYATGAMFNLPADGNSVLILIQDADEPLCSAEQNIGTLEPCNEDCTINATVSNIVCDDNGTGNDDTDDTFTFDLLVNGQNIGASWQSTNGMLTGSYGTTQNFGPFNIAGGDLNFDLQDLTTLTCVTSISVNAPTACSSCPQNIDAGTGSTLTCNNTIATLNGSSSEVGNYLWSGPNSFSSMDLVTTTTTSGWYFLTGTYTGNCVATDSVFIDIENDIPSANAGPDQFINCNISEVILDGSGSLGSNLEFEWTTSGGVFISNSDQITTTTAGIYILQLTDFVSGCTSTDQVEVFENTDLPSAVIYADPDNILDCVVSSITLTSDNEPNVIYSWNSIIAPEYIVTEGSIVDLIAIDTITGCQNFNQITISDIQDYPFVNLNPPTPISCYEPNSLIDGTNSQQGVNIIYNWYDANNNLIVGQNGNTLLVDNGGFYYLQLIDTLNGCENTDSVFVESLLNVPLAQAVEDVTLFCGETETNLNVNILGSTDDLEITWTTTNGNIVSGSSSQNPLVNQSGNYTVSIQDLISGCITTDNLEVVINTNIPQLMTANVYDETCFDSNDGLISITNISGGEPPFTYTLNGNPTDNSGQFQNLPPGFYNIVLTDANGCTLEDNFIINPGINLELNLPEVIEILEGNTGTIQAIVNVPIDSLDYIQWAPPELLSCDTCLTTTIVAVDDQTFQLTIIDNNGCIAIAVINIIVLPQIRIYIPNAFSPNFDGYNDYFTLFSNDQVEEILEMSIFDRWGEHVFQKENFQPNNPTIGWDGRLKGEEMNPAVFVYYFEVKLKNGKTRVFSGDVTLMK